MTYEERCIRQYKAHTKTRTDGSKLMRIDGGLWDLFQGVGFKNVSRFRIVRIRETGKRSLIQINGLNLSIPLRNTLLEECQ
jgi:hypothetical protein